ncbi:MAG: hypothetical protein Q7W30_09530 [Coriobacteriia bacterium]|nr:hypothetical protein [Coriobacteriia bacterium]
MIRINLLPPEIIQKRKDEARWKWVILGGVIAFGVVFLGYAFMFLQVQLKRTDVDIAKQEAARLQNETSRFAVFQEREAILSTRQSVVDRAAADRVDWARLLTELGLNLPKDTYLLSLAGAEPVPGAAGSMQFTGNAIAPLDEPQDGYKSLAKLLVRLSELGQLEGVWLSSFSIVPSADGLTGPTIPFTGSAKISGAATSTPGAGTPPPPPTP